MWSRLFFAETREILNIKKDTWEKDLREVLSDLAIYLVMAILKPQQAYSHIATQYDKIYSSHKCEIENEYIRTILKKNNIPDGQVLDLGCGTGNFLDWFPESFFRFEGVDISKEMINVAEYKYPEGKFSVGDMANKKFYKQ